MKLPSERYYLFDPWQRSENDEISKEDYDRLTVACKFLLNYISFEENIMAVKNAMYEYEMFTLAVSVEYEFNPYSDHNYFQDKRVTANGKVLSVLNAITSFRDQFPKFGKIQQPITAKDKFNESWQNQKQTNVQFDFCEVLRNYAQHNTQPVSGVTVGGGWDVDRKWRESHTSIYVNVEEVSSDRKVIPASKVKFLNHFGQKADVSLVLREGVDCLGDVSKDMRSWLTADFEQNSLVYQTHLDSGQRSDFPYLVLTTDPEDQKNGRKIFVDFLERAKKLKKAHILTHTANHYVSSRARGHTKA